MRRAPHGDQPALDEALEIPDDPVPTAQDLVDSWCRAYADRRHGAKPHVSVLKRVAGHCKAIATDCGDDRDAWVAAWHAAAAGGRDGKWDLTLYLADDRPMRRSPMLSAEQRVRQALLGSGTLPPEVTEGD